MARLQNYPKMISFLLSVENPEHALKKKQIFFNKNEQSLAQ
jgi:hypothetical protein